MSQRLVRIGELARRVRVSPHLLRAWETRYGLLRPHRSAGGFRLYTAADEERVRRMQSHLAEGLSAAEAARVALTESPAEAPAAEAVRPARPGVPAREDLGRLGELAARLQDRLDELDEAGAQEVLDRLLAEFTLQSVIREALVPYLHALGERWASGEASVFQEHFASNVVRGRLTGLARGWGTGAGPQALLACPPGELHDLGLLMFGLALSREGWAVSFLGADTPVPALLQSVDRLRPDLVVLAATSPHRFTEVAEDVARLGRTARLAVGGAGADGELAEHVGALLLEGDPVTAARSLSSE